MTENTKRLRDMYFELLDVFKNVCEENNITWYLWAGSMLGAIRHKGFIPWDDDIDVCVSSKSIDKLKAAKWPEGYAFGPWSWKMYLLCKKGTLMVNCKNNRDRRNVNVGLAGVKIDILPLFDVSDKSGKGIARCSSLIQKDWQIPKKCFNKKIIACFEGIELPIPEDYDEILKCMYGSDYMTPKKYPHNHMFFVDLNHGQEEYASGKLKIPDRKDFKPTDGEVMFAKE